MAFSLQSVMTVITKCDSFLITKCDNLFITMCHGLLLQSATAFFIRKWDSSFYYKVRQLFYYNVRWFIITNYDAAYSLESAMTVVTKCDLAGFLFFFPYTSEFHCEMRVRCLVSRQTPSTVTSRAFLKQRTQTHASKQL